MLTYARSSLSRSHQLVKNLTFLNAADGSGKLSRCLKSERLRQQKINYYSTTTIRAKSMASTTGKEGSSTNAASKFDKESLKERLDPVAYHVTQERGTERPFAGVYCKNKEPGLYRCIVCDETLFQSDHKYDSGCGWPAFWDAADKSKVKLTEDVSHGMVRTEVTCSKCGAHLGHLFDDGPQPSGQRYCINSCALKFEKKKP